jgi:Uma2 family endonuclease
MSVFLSLCDKMSTARKYQPHYLVADYQQWEGRWELWYGTAVAMAPSPFGPHERAVSEIGFQIQASIKGQPACSACRLYTGLDWIVQHDTVVRPDLMLVCGRQPELHLERAPTLVVEVLSESTADKDRTVKRELYESFGVEHYLLADPAAKSIQWLKLGPQNKFVDQAPEIADDGRFALETRGGCRVRFDRNSAFS